MTERTMVLQGVEITESELAAIYEITHDQNWTAVVKWLGKMRGIIASECLNAPEDVSRNLIRNGKHVVITILEDLPSLTKEMVNDIRQT